MFAQSQLIEELSEKETNEILIRASPMDEHGAAARPVETVRKWVITIFCILLFSLTVIVLIIVFSGLFSFRIMIYPPPPEKGGIALNNQDYACLGEDQFLNDVIIDFYLK